ncbi:MULTISPECIES: LPFR motif small protein [Prauserella]
MRRISEVLQMIGSTIANVVTLPFRALARVLRPRR